jgi:hypothetical protein
MYVYMVGPTSDSVVSDITQSHLPRREFLEKEIRKKLQQLEQRDA